MTSDLTIEEPPIIEGPLTIDYVKNLSEILGFSPVCLNYKSTNNINGAISIGVIVEQLLATMQREKKLRAALQEMWDSSCTNAKSTPSKKAFMMAHHALNGTEPSILRQKRSE